MKYKAANARYLNLLNDNKYLGRDLSLAYVTDLVYRFTRNSDLPDEIDPVILINAAMKIAGARAESKRVRIRSTIFMPCGAPKGA